MDGKAKCTDMGKAVVATLHRVLREQQEGATEKEREVLRLNMVLAPLFVAVSMAANAGVSREAWIAECTRLAQNIKDPEGL